MGELPRFDFTSRPRLTAAGHAALADLLCGALGLQHLDLSFQRPDLAALAADRAELPLLRTLRLRRSGLGPDDVANLTLVLRRCPRPHELDLEANLLLPVPSAVQRLTLPRGLSVLGLR